jgi:aromatic ring hydroxylase
MPGITLQARNNVILASDYRLLHHGNPTQRTVSMIPLPAALHVASRAAPKPKIAAEIAATIAAGALIPIPTSAADNSAAMLEPLFIVPVIVFVSFALRIT